MSSSFTISLDFELFWGVSDVCTPRSYGQNVMGERLAVPAMLAAFRKYDVSVDWATVGMLMCKTIDEWKSRFPSKLPKYLNSTKSNYEIADMVAQHPKLFFAPELVDSILRTSGQELCSHTYSHLYVDDPLITQYDLHFDAEMQVDVFKNYGASIHSLVFPRNRISEDYIKVMRGYGLTCFRGNPEGYLYRDGHDTLGGVFGRMLRYVLDHSPMNIMNKDGMPTRSICDVEDVPATIFLRPHRHMVLDHLHIYKIKKLMLYAAKKNLQFHLWWHPHNFGSSLDENMANLEKILSYYQFLNGEYGMVSVGMNGIAQKNMVLE